MMHGDTLQTTDYQPARQYVCLQTVQGAPTQSRSVLTHSNHRLKMVEVRNTTHVLTHIQGDSVARGRKLLSIKNYVIEIIT